MIESKKIVVFLQNRDFFGAQIVHIPLLLSLYKKYEGYEIILISSCEISTMLSKLECVSSIFISKSKFDIAKLYFSIQPDITINLRKQSLFIQFLMTFSKNNFTYKNKFTKFFLHADITYNTKIYRACNYLNLIEESTVLTLYKPKYKRVIILPGAGDNYKLWSITNYISLAKILSQKYTDYEICFVMGFKERTFKELIPNEFKCYIDLSFDVLLKFIQESSLVITNDCGPSHIGLISHVRVLSLYSDEYENASSITDEWFLKRDNTAFIVGGKRETIDSISIKEVYKKVEELLMQ